MRSSGSGRPVSEIPSSPQSPYVPVPSRRATRPMDRVQSQDRVGIKGSPLGRERRASTDADSSLGTSPGTPSLGGRDD
jgi:hypothetical protein